MGPKMGPKRGLNEAMDCRRGESALYCGAGSDQLFPLGLPANEISCFVASLSPSTIQTMMMMMISFTLTSPEGYAGYNNYS
jgi:hypothetical protein